MGKKTHLYHESLNIAMPQAAIVRAARSESQKIFGCLWYSLAKYLNLELTKIGMQSDRHGPRGCSSQREKTR
jgi:hypothetical protein